MWLLIRRQSTAGEECKRQLVGCKLACEPIRDDYALGAWPIRLSDYNRHISYDQYLSRFIYHQNVFFIFILFLLFLFLKSKF